MTFLQLMSPLTSPPAGVSVPDPSEHELVLERRGRRTDAHIIIAVHSTVLGPALGFVPLPWVYWPALAVLLLAYCALAHAVKAWFVRRWGL